MVTLRWNRQLLLGGFRLGCSQWTVFVRMVEPDGCWLELHQCQCSKKNKWLIIIGIPLSSIASTCRTLSVEYLLAHSAMYQCDATGLKQTESQFLLVLRCEFQNHEKRDIVVEVNKL